SPAWEPRFGGELKMVDPSGNVTAIEPEYNSVVLFDVAAGTTHYVDPIPPAAGDRARLSIGGWYHKAG
ncbi:MAG: 2OG-Fe(II) oxygenase, partial [Actinomycetota bacterium]|nr:2OG-Fe(II) oxygenase [Actinomycetota bacterium]